MTVHMRDRKVPAIILGVVVLFFCPLQVCALEAWCISDRHRVGAWITEAFKSFGVTGPVAVSDIRYDPGLAKVAYHLQQLAAGALSRHQIPTVEIDKDLLKDIEKQIFGQMNRMIDSGTAVEIGKWVAARYLLFGHVTRIDHQTTGMYQYRLVNLETRQQIVVNDLTFMIQNCEQMSILHELPAPTPGDGDFLPAPASW